MARGGIIAVQGFLAVLLITPSLLFGAVHEGVLAGYLVLAAALLVAVTVDRRFDMPRLDVPSTIFIVLILFTALQLIPFPAVVVNLLSPSTYDIRARALEPLGQGLPGFMPLTLDVPLTLVELSKLILYLAVYWSCTLWIRKFGPGYVLNLIVATGVACAVIFLAHKALLFDKVYGIYTPIHGRISVERLSAPLINENHLAGLLGMCSAVAIGLALDIRERTRRILSIGIAALVGGSLALTLSRGGIAAFIGGQGVFILLRILARSRSNEKTLRRLAWLPVGLAVSVGLGLFVAQDAIIGEFLGGDVKKLDLAVEGLPLIGRFWVTGVGRGAFWVGFPLVSELAARTTFSHAENGIIQLLADYGIFVGSFAIVGMGVVIGEFLKRPPTRVTQTAVLAALVAFGLHNLVDFNMEIPGVAVIAVALLAVLICSRRFRITRLVNRPLSRPVLGALATAALVMSLFVGLFAAEYNVDKEERDYLEALTRGDEEPFSKEKLAQVLKRHPADWYIPFLVGVRTFHQGSENPLPWLTRALDINAYSASTHLYIGRVLLRADELDQAMREFRLAVRFHSGFAGAVANYLVAKAPHFRQLSPIAVTREDKLVLWGALAHAFLVNGLGEESEAADKEIFKVNPNEPRSLARQTQRLIDRKQFEQALELAEKLTTIPDYGPLGARLEAAVHQKKGTPDKALAVLERELKRSPHHPGLLTQLAWTRQRAGDYQGALETTLVLRTLAQDIKDQARVAILEGDISVAEGRIQMALARYGEASMVDPSDIRVLMKIADVAQKNGDMTRALIALKKIIVIDFDNEFAKERIEKIEKKEKLNQIFGQ
ncbi:MAG: hypothetical protein GY762_19450 [Proteobacteria bacterium]|nr:hypothetical protein [Pseudomonadota bacterium]